MSNKNDDYTILLYYKYAHVANPQQLRKAQFKLCKKLEIRGRILISDQGLNGTISGSDAAIKKYMAETTKYPGFEDIEWKISKGPKDAFPRLRVVVRDEIVTLGLKKQSADVHLENKAPYIEPQELLNLYEDQEDFIIIDARNKYEAEVGTFRNAIVPDIKTFKEFPEYAKKHFAQFKNKQVVTFCTGGIRCEKASAFLKENGFKNVRQLHGGIHRYSDETGGKNFDGKMYVFDNRRQVDVNNVNPTVISLCKHCGEQVARYSDCVNDDCNLHYICCQTCEDKMHGACSETCKREFQKLVNMRNILVSLMVY